MSWKENKPEWRSAVRFVGVCFICRRMILRGLEAAGDDHEMNGSVFLCIAILSLVYSAPLWTVGGHANSRPLNPPVCIEGKKHSTHWSLLYSSNFKIYWDWLVFANNSQANSSTKHEVRKRLRRLVASPNIKTGGSWLAVKMFRDQYYQPRKKKKFAQEHLNLPKTKQV